MATYVNDLRLKEIATGDESGTWGASVNTQYELIAEAMGAGTEAIANASTHTITMADGATDGFRCTFLRLTGGGQACTVTLAPNTVSHTWIIRNATSYALTFTQGSGANVIIAAGQAKIVSTDGAGSGAIVYECLEDLELGGTLTVGVDDTGHDVKFFGATSGAYMLWDESADDLKLVGAAGLTVAGDIDIDGTANLDIVDVDGAVNFAADVTYADGADIITASAGTSNFRAGVNAGNSIESGGNYNVVVGDEAGTAITTGDNNVAVGYKALEVDNTGSNNTALGYSALEANTTAADNVAVGYKALELNSTGASNTALGKQAMQANTTASNSTAVGFSALYANTTGRDNTAVGFSAGITNTTGLENTALGMYALRFNTTGNTNTALGLQALHRNTTASDNTAVGRNSMEQNTTGAQNVAVGSLALDANTEGDNNVSLGYGSLTANTTADNNVAIGRTALEANTTGAGNVAVGKDALIANTTASNNVAVGMDALTANTEGHSNTAVGRDSGNAITTGDNNLCLGYQAGISGSPGGAITTGDNFICLGDENVTAAHIQVDWTIASDERDKTDFTALDLGLDFVKALAPVTYKWDKRAKYAEEGADLDAITHDGTHKEDWLDVGFKAQAVEALEIAAGYDKDNKTNLVSSHTGDGKQMGLQYSKFVPILVKAIQEQQTLIESLTARITTLEG